MTGDWLNGVCLRTEHPMMERERPAVTGRKGFRDYKPAPDPMLKWQQKRQL
jgi:hypothetical protein